MKVQFHLSQSKRSEGGSAIVIVLVLLLAMIAFVEANTGTLRSFKRELQVLEQRQMIKYHPLDSASRSGTNQCAQVERR